MARRIVGATAFLTKWFDEDVALAQHQVQACTEPRARRAQALVPSRISNSGAT